MRNDTRKQVHVGNVPKHHLEAFNPFSKWTLRKEFIRWADISGWNMPVAFTGTLKKARLVHSGPNGRWVRLNLELAQQNVRHFRNLVDRKVYGGDHRRHGKRLPFVAVLEQKADERFHCHAAIDCPKTWDYPEFEQLLILCWHKTHWAYRETKIVPNADAGWIDYMAKWQDKGDYAQQILIG